MITNRSLAAFSLCLMLALPCMSTIAQHHKPMLVAAQMPKFGPRPAQLPKLGMKAAAIRKQLKRAELINVEYFDLSYDSVHVGGLSGRLLINFDMRSRANYISWLADTTRLASRDQAVEIVRSLSSNKDTANYIAAGGQEQWSWLSAPGMKTLVLAQKRLSYGEMTKEAMNGMSGGPVELPR